MLELLSVFPSSCRTPALTPPHGPLKHSHDHTAPPLTRGYPSQERWKKFLATQIILPASGKGGCRPTIRLPAQAPAAVATATTVPRLKSQPYPRGGKRAAAPQVAKVYRLQSTLLLHAPLQACTMQPPPWNHRHIPISSFFSIYVQPLTSFKDHLQGYIVGNLPTPR